LVAGKEGNDIFYTTFITVILKWDGSDFYWGTYSFLFLLFENKLTSESTFLKLYAYFVQKKPGGETEQQELTYPSLRVYDLVQWLIKLQAKSSLCLFCTAQVVGASSLLNQVQ
jgi:hypothetical protein